MPNESGKNKFVVNSDNLKYLLNYYEGHKREF